MSSLNKLLLWILRHTFYQYVNLYGHMAPFMAGLLMCRFTGWLFLWFWQAGKSRIFNAGCDGTGFFAMRMILLAFLVPTGIAPWVLDRHFYLWRGELGPGAAIFCFCYYLLFYMWLAGAIREAFRQRRVTKSMKRRFRNLIPCNEQKQLLFRQTCRQLGIRSGRLRLYECYNAQTAFIWGSLLPKVILPVDEGETDEETLRIILIHELTHYKQHAQLWKRLLRLALVLQWWSIPLKQYKTEFLRSIEYRCDDASCGPAGGEYAYYQSLLKLASAHKTNLNGLYATSMIEEEGEVLKRIKRAVLKKKTERHFAKGLLALAVMGILSCSTAVCALGAGITAFVRVSKVASTEAKEVENRIPDKLPVYTQAVNADNHPETIGEITVSERGDAYVYWTVPSASTTVSSALHFSKDQVVTMGGAIQPSNKTVKVGIRPTSDGEAEQYVNASSFVYAGFVIPSDGMYVVFVSNISDTSVMTMINVETD